MIDWGERGLAVQGGEIPPSFPFGLVADGSFHATSHKEAVSNLERYFVTLLFALPPRTVRCTTGYP